MLPRLPAPCNHAEAPGITRQELWKEVATMGIEALIVLALVVLGVALRRN